MSAETTTKSGAVDLDQCRSETFCRVRTHIRKDLVGTVRQIGILNNQFLPGFQRINLLKFAFKV